MEDEGLQTQPETNTNTEEKIEKKENISKTSSSNNANAGTIVALLMAIIIAIAGVVLGVTALMKANQALTALDKNGISASNEVADSEEDFIDEEDVTGSVDYITITYNNGKDYIDIFDGGMDYYTIDENDNVSNREVSKDTSQIFSEIRDKYLSNLTDEEVKENATWGIEFGDFQNDYAASGTGEAPEWFNNILNQLELDKYGYQSKNL